jgi:hypothetical protein
MFESAANFAIGDFFLGRGIDKVLNNYFVLQFRHIFHPVKGLFSAVGNFYLPETGANLAFHEPTWFFLKRFSLPVPKISPQTLCDQGQGFSENL